MDNPLFVTIFVFVLVLGTALLLKWRKKSKKESSVLPETHSAVESTFQDAPCEDQQVSDRREKTGIAQFHEDDPGFDETLFKEHVTAFYLQLQTALSECTIEGLRQQMTEDTFALLKTEEDKRAAEGTDGKFGNRSVRSVELINAWQENGRDFVKVQYLLDSPVDHPEEGKEEHVDNITDGKSDSAKFWLFSRISGPNPWYLSAVESP